MNEQTKCKLKKIRESANVNTDSIEHSLTALEDIATHFDYLANASASSETLIKDVDEQFAKATGLRKKDFAFLFTSILIQSLRWVLMPKLKIPNIESQTLHIEKEQRLKNREKEHQNGPYQGKSSGSEYEHSALKEYLNKQGYNKEMTDSQNFYQKRYKYRSWIEILTQPVPYDAMNALDKEQIPSIAGLNGNFEGKNSNIYGGNHHVATLGHDPVLGWIFGTANIMSSTISMVTYSTYGVVRGHKVKAENAFKKANNLAFSDQCIDYSDIWSLQDMVGYCYRSIQEDPKRILAAVTRHKIHMESDKYCKEGLPIPFLSSIDPKKAQELIEKGWNSEEFKYLLKSDLQTIGISAALSIIINLILEGIYTLCMDQDESIQLQKVRLKKILAISSIIVSSSNVLWTAISKDISKLDIGGIGVALITIFKSNSFIENVKEEFISEKFYKKIEEIAGYQK